VERDWRCQQEYGENVQRLIHFLLFGNGGTMKFTPFHSARIFR
jgi:hypothetical protein